MQNEMIPFAELLDFCKKQNVEISMKYERDTECFIIKMRNSIYTIENSIPWNNLKSPQFKLENLLCEMADRLDIGPVEKPKEIYSNGKYSMFAIVE